MFLQKCFNDELDKLKFNKINSVFYKNLKYVTENVKKRTDCGSKI